jgi:hypothetical protein
MKYRISPGLYAVGNPCAGSPLLVTANYKMTFDRLRKELAGIDAWMMVLDTKGINVWCAAGKGTFGTEEVVRRTAETGVSQVVSHRRLILPQLAAPGVAAHEVQKRSGFKVVYGPVRASDLPAFLRSGNQAAPEARKVGFGFKERIVLAPLEFASILKIALIVFVAYFLLNRGRLSPGDVLPYLGAIFIGTVMVPALLPFIPGRALSFKGWVLGVLWAAGVVLWGGEKSGSAVIHLLILPALSSFLALNFTGSTAYTSLSGVLREMKIALPLIILSAGSGIVLLGVGLISRLF